MSKTPDLTKDVALTKSKYADQNSKVLAEHADIEGSNWQLSLITDLNDENFLGSLQELAAKTGQPNPFFEHEFLTLGMHYIARRKIYGLVLSEVLGSSESFKFFVPVTLERVGRIGPRFFRVWSNEYAPLAQPLLDDSDIAKTIEELSYLFSKSEIKAASGLLFNSLPANSTFTKQLLQEEKLDGYITKFNDFERAALEPIIGTTYAEKFLSGKRRQRLNKARKELRKRGEISFHEAKSVTDTEIAMLDFLYMENRGWKGRQKTSMASKPSTRTFGAELTRQMALSNKCRIFSMQVDGITVASFVVLGKDGHYITWKTSFLEAYAKYSVGNQLLVHVNETLSSEPNFKFLDSVAVGDNETANRFWPNRIRLLSLAIGFGPSGKMIASTIAGNLSIFGLVKRKLRRLLNH